MTSYLGCLSRLPGLSNQTACSRKSFNGWTTCSGLYGAINAIAGIAILLWLIAAVSAAGVGPAKYRKGTAECSRCWYSRCVQHSQAQQQCSNFKSNSSRFHCYPLPETFGGIFYRTILAIACVAIRIHSIATLSRAGAG